MGFTATGCAPAAGAKGFWAVGFGASTGRGAIPGAGGGAELPSGAVGRGRGLGAAVGSPGLPVALVDGGVGTAGRAGRVAAGLVPAVALRAAAGALVAELAGRAGAVRFGTATADASPEKSMPWAGASPTSGNRSDGSWVATAENFGVLFVPGITGRFCGFRMKKNMPPATPTDRHVIKVPSSNELPPDSSDSSATGISVVVDMLVLVGVSVGISSAFFVSVPVLLARSSGLASWPASDCKS